MRRGLLALVALSGLACRQLADVHDDVGVDAGSSVAGAGSGAAGVAGSSAAGAAGTSAGTGCPGAAGAPLVRVAGVCVDAFEATRAELDAFMASGPKPPPGPCGGATLQAPVNASDPATYPARGVTFCTAKAFCLAQGKRLCRVGAVDEWQVACTGGEPGRVFTYGNEYDPKRCNADKYLGAGSCKDDATCGPIDALAASACHNGLGVRHLSGNVQEWVDACADGWCELRGGGFDDDGSDTKCTFPAPHEARSAGMGDVVPSAGVRCCADPT